MHVRRLAPVAALLVAACGPLAPSPRRCAAPADCEAGAFCRAGTCAASAPPVAAIAAPASPWRSHAHLLFDGSGSRDPDEAEGDAVASWLWSAAAVDAPCAPVRATGSGPSFDLVTDCAGTFEVRLVVADTTGRQSLPARLVVPLEPSPNPPVASVAGPAALDHRCSGAPLRCTTRGAGGEGSFSLAATAGGAVTGGFRYAWSATPPPGLPGPEPRVRFDPPDAPDPAVTIETDGTAIAGEYRLAVTATDEAGLAAVGVHRLLVGNRPPVVGGGGEVLVGHRFDAAASRFLASGAVQATVADPDGDPLVAGAFTAERAGDGGNAFELAAAGLTADFAIEVGYARPEDALFLAGGAGLARTIRYVAEDVNGGRAEARWEVRVANRPPRVAEPRASASVDHSFDVPSLSYLASAELSAYVDDDGDPIVQRGPTGSLACPAVDPVVGSGRPRLQCRRVFAGTPEAHRFAAFHPVRVVVGDPFAALPPADFVLEIRNRPPRLAAVPVPTACTAAPRCCQLDPILRRCAVFAFDAAAASITVPPPVVDDDGDPFSLELRPGAGTAASPASMTCSPGTCPLVTLSVAAQAGSCLQLAIPAVVGDGGPPVEGAVAVGACLDPGP